MSDGVILFEPVEFELPFPDRRLSPNSSKRHWRDKEDARRDARDLAAWIGEDCKQPTNDSLQAVITFCPPNKRRRDLDNLLASMKSTLDGLCAGIGIDDAQIRRITIQWGEVDTAKKEGKTLVKLERLEA